MTKVVGSSLQMNCANESEKACLIKSSFCFGDNLEPCLVDHNNVFYLDFGNIYPEPNVPSKWRVSPINQRNKVKVKITP